MINFKDRIVEHPLYYTVKDVAGLVKELTPAPGNITESGTPLNRANMLAIQGYEDSSTLIDFSSGIVITSRNEYGVESTPITFNADGSITISSGFQGSGGDTVTTTTKLQFLSNGNIGITSEVTA